MKLKYLVPILILMLVAGVLATMVFYAVFLRTPRDAIILNNTVALAATCSCHEAKHLWVFYVGFGNDVSIQVTLLSGHGPLVVYILEDYYLVNGTNVNTTMTWQFHSYVPSPNIHYEVWANKYELEMDNLGSQIANVTAQVTEHYRYCFLSVCNR